MTVIVIDQASLESIVREAVRAEVADILRRLQEQDDLLTVRDAASICGLSLNAMRVKVSRGQVEVVRSGRSVRVRRSDLRAMWS